VFSEPSYQTLYEVHVQQGKSHEEALELVKSFIETEIATAIRMVEREKNKGDVDFGQPWKPYAPNKFPYQKWELPDKQYWCQKEDSIEEINMLKKKLYEALYGKEKQS
jgi:hypothetical protein